jgi:hypothetical protein
MMKMAKIKEMTQETNLKTKRSFTTSLKLLVRLDKAGPRDFRKV